MFEFEILQELNQNPELLKLLKNCTYAIKKGKIKNLLHTNLQFVEPTQYLITYPKTITILEYRISEISSKPFYIKETQKKYNFKEIQQILINLG